MRVETPKEKDRKREREINCDNQNCISNLFNWFILELISSDHANGEFIWINPFCFRLIIFQTHSSRYPTN